jgi:ubiquinone/menaquinone biosynthesis C-methylase UbiE
MTQTRAADSAGLTKERLPSAYVDPMSVDAWRHRRMLMHCIELVRHRPDSTWLTVGDGRFGSDAAFLLEHGIDAVASDLTIETLRYAAQHGYIRQYRAENAEHLTIADNAFDFVLCKESYHHFPRPPVALYEMLRVARHAVLMVEPLDESRPLNLIKQLIKRAIRGDKEVEFETSGNYLYRTSVRELSKLLTAMGLRMLAVRRFNDFFHPRFARGHASAFDASYCVTRLGIAVQDVLTASRLLGYGLVSTIVFKQLPEAELRASLRRQGYRLIELPKNPYA